MECETDDFIVARVPRQYRAYVVLSAAILMEITIGFVGTMGNMLPYLVSYLRWKVNPDQDAGSLMWLSISLPFCFLVGGCLERMVGTRAGATLGSALYTGCIASTYFTLKMGLPWLFLSLGIGTSLGMGIVYNCMLIEAQRAIFTDILWMPGHLGLAGGLIVSSFASGSFFLAPLQTIFINPNNFPTGDDGYFTQVDLLEKIPQMFLLFAALFGCVQIFALTFIAHPTVNDTKESLMEDGEVLIEDSVLGALHGPSVGKTAALSSATFYAISASLFFESVGTYIVGGFYKTFGQTFIDDDFFLSTILSYSAVMNCFSRILWGVLADKVSYRTSMSVAWALSALLAWAFIFICRLRNSALYLIDMCLLALCGGVGPAMIPYGLHRCFGAKNFGIIYGFAQVGVASGSVAVALISQFLLPHVGLANFFVLGGASAFIVSLISLRVHRTRYGGQLALSGDNVRRKLGTACYYGSSGTQETLSKNLADSTKGHFYNTKSENNLEYNIGGKNTIATIAKEVDDDSWTTATVRCYRKISWRVWKFSRSEEYDRIQYGKIDE